MKNFRCFEILKKFPEDIGCYKKNFRQGGAWYAGKAAIKF